MQIADKSTIVVGGIEVTESESPPSLTTLTPSDSMFLNTRFTSDFRIRSVLADKIHHALEYLPQGMALMIFEAYRPRSRQFQLWNGVIMQIKKEHPGISDADLHAAACRLVSDPNGFGSGHQAAVAIDVTLCDKRGNEFAMGTNVQEFGAWTKTDAEGLPQDFVTRRTILRDALLKVGIINYPDEWWHFSYGDRLWAEILGYTSAFFAPLDNDRA